MDDVQTKMVPDKITAKFKCESVKETEWNKEMTAYAVVGGSEENKDFNSATPSGTLVIAISKDAPASQFFQPGDEFYMDFYKTKVEPQEPQGQDETQD